MGSGSHGSALIPELPSQKRRWEQSTPPPHIYRLRAAPVPTAICEGVGVAFKARQVLAACPSAESLLCFSPLSIYY